LTSFKPPADLPKVNILLTGEVGAGKSSLISSIDSIFKRRISRRAPHGQATSSFTRLLTRYTFRSNAQNWPARGAAPFEPQCKSRVNYSELFNRFSDMNGLPAMLLRILNVSVLSPLVLLHVCL